MNDQQIAFVALYFIYVGVVLAFHATILLYPFRLLTTFLHEISHAIACWLTCGSVRAIKVYDNEGGVTSYVGGCRILIIPAGYVGSAVWGCAFVSFSGGRKTSTGAAGVLIGVLLYALCFAPNKTMVLLNLSYAVMLSVFILVEWKFFTPILNYVVLFFGVFVGIHAIFDTYTDTIRRTVLRSDAYACYEQCPCCLPKCVGVQWALLNLLLQIVGAWIAMIQLSDHCNEAGWWECLSGEGRFDFEGDRLWEWEERVAHDLGDWFKQ